MLKNLPYSSLRAFEAVVRLRGFVRAAEELNVTQSSISQHVRLLEEWTSKVLLIRGKNESRATHDGQRLADAVAKGLGEISAVCESLQSKEQSNPAITVSCPPGFAVNWLFPRLLKFDEAFPNIPISIQTGLMKNKFSFIEEDISIHYSKAPVSGVPASGFFCEKLLSETVFPVCSPKLLKGKAPLKSIADLSKHILLLDEMEGNQNNFPIWQQWAKNAGEPLPKPKNIRQFSQANMVVQAAVEGMGVALGRETIVCDAIKEGRLVRPFKAEMNSEYFYWFVCPQKAVKSKRILAFKTWLFDAVAKPNYRKAQK